MKKKNKILALIAVLIIGAAIFVYFKQKAANERLVQLPKQKTVSKIEFTKSNNYNLNKYEDKKSIAEIYDVLLQSELCTSKKSVSDTPQNVVGGVTTIIITTKDNEEIFLNTYKGKDGKYYVEKPYVSIHKVTEQNYNALIKRTK